MINSRNLIYTNILDLTQRNTPDIEAYLPGAPEIQAMCRV